MFDFRNSAVRETSLSEIMSGRDNIKTEDIIAKYPNGITVNGFDIVALNDKTYPVLTFAEDPTKFFNGGSVITRIVDGWVAGFGGDIEACSQALAQSGGVKMKLSLSKTKRGNNITRVDII